jgi:hypothetical protein
MTVTPDDVFNHARIIGHRRNTMNKVGSNVITVNVLNFPGLNTLAISLGLLLLASHCAVITWQPKA